MTRPLVSDPEARCVWRHGDLDDEWLILAYGFTPRSGPASCRALAAASPAFERALILSPSSFATMTMMRTVSWLGFGISAATKSTPTSAPQPCLSVAG